MHMPPPKPEAPAVVAENIPDELKATDRWVCWRYQWRDEDWQKVPVNCRTTRKADVTDPRAVATFAEAWAYYRGHKVNGLGFVLVEDDPFTGVDLDDCRDAATGQVQEWAQDIIRSLNSYSEVSPSGAGVRVFVRGKCPPDCRKRRGNIEVYCRQRYLTVTGVHLAGTPATIEDRQPALDSLVARYLTVPSREPVTSAVAWDWEPSDADVIARARAATNGEKFTRLYERGDVREHGRDDSRADLALCSMLAYWLGPFATYERVERLFDGSALGRRPKWRARADYRERTIEQALQGVQHFGKAGRGLTRGAMINHSTRIKQEEAGIKHADADGGRHVVLEIEQEVDSIRMAEDLADTNGSLPDWQASFTLARRLRCLREDHPELFRSAVEAFCRRSERDFTAFWYAYLAAWPKVMLAEGTDVFAWATGRADEHPIRPEPDFGKEYAKVASIAFHLADYRAGQPFWLPVERLAALLNVSAMTVSNILKLLRRNGVIADVNAGAYSYIQHKAKEYLFTWVPPEEAAA